jgi:crotonobetainyl-CoA:carnitine CoA-transferase CaiB-like acyl-CoA transferase
MNSPLQEPRPSGGALGAHTAEVLAELGLSAEEIEALKAAKVVG